LFVSSFVICLPVALVTIVARIWGTLLEKSHCQAVGNPHGAEAFLRS